MFIIDNIINRNDCVKRYVSIYIIDETDNKMEFRELKTFQAVATLMSFHKAADVLHYAQSTISAQIRSLENNIGKALFKREGKKISLTKAGSALLHYAERLIAIEKEIRYNLGCIDEPHGSLSIKLPQSVSTYLLPSLIKDFSIVFSGIHIDFDWCTHYSLAEAFDSGNTDLAFLITNDFNSKKLHKETLFNVNLNIICHPHNPLAKKNKMEVSDFKNEILILPKSDCSYGHILEEILLKANANPKVVYHFNSIEAIKQTIAAGTGVTIIPDFAIKPECESGKLTVLHWKGPDFNAELLFIWNREKQLMEPIQVFMNMVRKYLK
jgi:DNA-binding transcriptional LysR family regulator